MQINSIQIPLIGTASSQLTLGLQIQKRSRGNPQFKPKWSGPTKAIRIPEKYASQALELIKAYDSKALSPDKLSINELWSKSETTYDVDPVTGYRRANVFLIPISDLKTDPKRFQYKMIQYDSHGSTNSLLGVKKWDENLAGTLLVWQDSDDGIVYVINGHNRYSKALSLGIQYLKCEFITASNAIEARAIGALRNIAEGNGTAIDAAKFFRDKGLRPSQIKECGYLPLTRSTVKNGMALCTLIESLFSRLCNDELSIDDGSIIGASLDATIQSQVIEALDKGISGPALAELCTLINNSEKEEIEQFSLFGSEVFTVSNAIARAQKISWLKIRLSKDRRIFGSVARNAETLERGNNRIDKGISSQISDTARNALLLFDQLKLQAGPLASLINRAANNEISDDSYYSSALAILSNPLAS